MAQEVQILFKEVGADDVLAASKAVHKTVADLKRLASTPIEARFAKDGILTGFDKLEQQVMSAREQLKQFNIETGKTKTVNETVGKSAKQAAASLEHLGITYEKTRGKMKSPLMDTRVAGMKRISDMKALAATPIESSLFRDTVGPAFGNISKQVMQARMELKQFNTEMNNTKEKTKAAGMQLGFVTRLLAAMAIRKVAHDLVDVIDSYTAFENKLKTVVRGTLALKVAQQDLVKIANQVQMPLESVATIFSRTSRAVTGLGKNQIQVTKFTETLTKAIKIGGSSTIESSNALIQLSQGLGSGALRGDELRSVLEQLPIVAELIAAKMKVPTSALRKLGSEGKITTGVIFDAITEATKTIDAQFKQLKPTLSGTWEVMKNKWMIAVGEATPVTETLTRALGFLNDHFNTVIRSVTAFVGVIGLVYTVSAAKTLAAALSNPWIAAAAAIGTVIIALGAFGNEMTDAGKTVDTFGDKLKTARSHMDAFGFFKSIAQSFKEDLETMIIDPLDKLGTMLGGLFSKEYKLQLGIADWDVVYARLAWIIDQIRVITPFLVPGANLVAGGYAASQLETAGGKKSPLQHLKEGNYFKAAGQAAMTVINPFAELQMSDEYSEYTHRTRNAVEAQKKVANEEAARKKEEDAKIAAERERLEKLKLPVTTKSEPAKKKGPKESGKNFSQLIEDAELDALRASINDMDADVFKKLESALDKLKPSILKTLKEVDKQIAAVQENYKQDLKDSFFSGPPTEEAFKKQQEDQAKLKSGMEAQVAALKAKNKEYIEEYNHLEEAIRMEVTRDYYIKQRIKDEEEADKRVQERLDKQVARIKEIEGYGKNAEKDRTLFKQGVAEELNPNLKIQQEINRLEMFKETIGDDRYIELANKKIADLKLQLVGLDAPFKSFSGQMNSIFGQDGVLVKGFADTLVSAKNLRQGLADLMDQIGKQALSAAIQLPLNLGIAAIQGAVGGAILPAGTGPGSVPLPGHAAGGYTGNYGTSQIAGVVHGQEYVVNAAATSKYRPMLETINKGGTPTAAGGGSQVNVQVHNHAGVHVETTKDSNGDINIQIIKAIREHTGTVVASEINNPNSNVSKSMAKHLNTQRRRV